MKRKNKDGFLVLFTELEADIIKLNELLSENERAWGRIQAGAKDSLDYAALGYTIHNIYCLLENYFLRVSKYFENNLEQNGWHKELLHRMSLEIDRIRPALLDRDLAEDLDEYRSFRHLFRNLYQSRIIPERLAFLQTRLPSLLDKFKQKHTLFVEKLKAIAEKL
ncbi:MAG: antitoxin [Spirochaetota bacterium]